MDGRTAVITGGAQGLGLQIARTFGEHGARIVLGDRDGGAARAAAAELSADGIEAIAATCDVTDQQMVEALIAAAVDAYGSVDVMVNNAGFTRDAVLRKMTVSDFRAVLDVHVVGTWLGIRSAVDAMRTAGTGGSIINMSSISGKVGNAGQTNYSAAKAGIVGLTKAAAKETARYGIRVNAIQPGVIEGAMTAQMPEELLAQRIGEIPLGRIGVPRDVADAALFLASDLSSYMTGAVLEVAGGRHM
ncbi:MAG TPA: 3-oxoacyl-ACP reductase FabG [Galbitalea sp.]|nr:3-oxoacyl-ACP reductase FabG [Galbitalea sp.]